MGDFRISKYFYWEAKMKKIFFTFVFVLILVFSSVACADESTSEPILFRGIEWGSSFSDALFKLPDGIKFYSLKTDSNYTVNGNMLDERGRYFDGHVAGYTYAQSHSLEGMKVAGYELDGLRLRFAWVPGDDGLLIKDNDHTALFFAEYEISPKDFDAAYTDLTAKLSSLYGEPSSTKFDFTVYISNYTIWNGGEGTMVVLLGKQRGSGSNEILIRYGTSKGDKWLQNAYDALVLQETIEAASNIDGL